MRLEVENVEIDNQKLEEALSVKFGTTDTSQIFDKMVQSKLIELTGDFSVEISQHVKPDVKKLMKMLAGYGIIIVPKAKINVDKLRRFVGEEKFNNVCIVK